MLLFSCETHNSNECPDALCRLCFRTVSAVHWRAHQWSWRNPQMNRTCFVFAVSILASALVWWPANQQAALVHYLLIPGFMGLWTVRRRQLALSCRLILLAAFLLLSEALGHLSHFCGLGWHSSVPMTFSATLLPSFAGRCLIAICAFFARPIGTKPSGEPHDQETTA
jgi:hypothetical protein